MSGTTTTVAPWEQVRQESLAAMTEPKHPEASCSPASLMPSAGPSAFTSPPERLASVDTAGPADRLE